VDRDEDAHHEAGVRQVAHYILSLSHEG
jgi:hypothetical protein